MRTSTSFPVLCGVLCDTDRGTRCLLDEPGEEHETCCWDNIAEDSSWANPWYAPIEDEV